MVAPSAVMNDWNGVSTPPAAVDCCAIMARKASGRRRNWMKFSRSVKNTPAPSSIQTTTYWNSQVVSVSMNWATGIGTRAYLMTLNLRVPTGLPSSSTSTL